MNPVKTNNGVDNLDINEFFQRLLDPNNVTNSETITKSNRGQTSANTEDVVNSKWTVGQKCEIYESAHGKQWTEAEIIRTFEDKEGKWVRVQYGRNIKEIPIDDPKIRSTTSGGVNWSNVVQAVSQELYPKIATPLAQSVEKLRGDRSLKRHDLSVEATDRVIEELTTRKVLYNKEIKYIKDLVKRADSFRWNETDDGVDSYDLRQLGNGDDFNDQWNGLNINLLIDIYSVHKALLFGQFKFDDYTMNDFMSNIHDAEKKVFKETICTPIVTEHEKAFTLSFHPSYVINDDIFEIMAFHFAVSALVNCMSADIVGRDELRVRSIVVPSAITSIYDSTIDHTSSIDNVSDHIQSISSSNRQVSCRVKPNIADIEPMTQSLSEIFDFIIQRAATGDIVIVFNRRNGFSSVTMFECGDISELKEFYKNYYLGFDFNVHWKSENGNGSNRVVRCWLNFGINQRMRFYPEYAVWIIPRLFARNDGMMACEFIQRLYGADYKWGWRLNLDDPDLNRYYHIITGFEHISNNYNRNEMVEDSKETECGIRDHLEQNLQRRLAGGLRQFFEDNAFDSDAILEDVVGAQNRNKLRAYGRPKGSNIASFLSEWNHLHFRALRHRLFRRQDMVCCSENVIPIEECPFIEDVVADLQRLKECDLEIDVTNYWLFDLGSIVAARDHMISVHGLLSDDNKEDGEQIRCHILKHIQCGEGSECKALKAQKLRRREAQRAERVEEEPEAVTAECDVLSDVLYDAHCRVFHAENLLNRSSPINHRFEIAVSDSAPKTEQKEESKTEEKTVSNPVAIDFGLSVLRWLGFDKSPRFDSLRDELIKNPHSTIDPVIYDQIRSQSAAKIKDTVFTLNEMISLKSYSDTNEFQAALGRAHWDNGSVSDEMKLSFYRWAMTLYGVHLYHSQPIPTKTVSATKPRPLYTGLSRLLTLSHELGAYYGPLSTTISIHVANGFSNGRGQIYTFLSSYINPLTFCLGIDMKTISCHSDEQEVMLYHQFLPIQSTKTFASDDAQLVDHLMFSLQSRSAPIVRKEAFYKKLGIKWCSSWTPLILSHHLLFEESKCGNKLIFDRLGEELNAPYFELFLLLRDAMFMDHDFNLKLRKTSKISLELFSQFTFKVNNKTFAPMDFDEFEIECDPKTFDDSHFSGLEVFCKPKDQTFESVKLYNVPMNQNYGLKGEDPLRIDKRWNVIAFQSESGFSRKLEIQCSSDIIVSKNGGISMVVTDLETSLDSQTRMGRTGGVMTLFSDGNVINDGALYCSATEDVKSECTAVNIVAESFINNGTVRCDSVTGSVFIECSDYENTGMIYPAPDIIIKSKERGMLRTGGWSKSEQVIPLSVYDHRGHYGHCHPERLLKDVVSCSYMSDISNNRKSIGDWIIFRMNNTNPMKPSSIKIKNSGNSFGIKRIALWLGKDGGRWTKLCEDIDGIHCDNKEEQTFAVKALPSDELFMDTGYDLLLVEVVMNHSQVKFQNCFYYINVNGYSLLNTD